jgi:hypothetical protein
MRQPKTTTHRILAIICFSSILSGFRPPATSEPAGSFYPTDTTTDAKLAAFEILTARCNGCHVRQNPAKVFTKANMNSLTLTIYDQVFIKKECPAETGSG